MDIFELLIQIVYAPIQLFVWKPERAVIVAFIFLGLLIINLIFSKGKVRIKFVWPLALAFLAWLLFSLNEYNAYLNKSNIRIDLLYFGPAMIAISVFAFYKFVRSFFYNED